MKTYSPPVQLEQPVDRHCPGILLVLEGTLDPAVVELHIDCAAIEHFTWPSKQQIGLLVYARMQYTWIPPKKTNSVL